MSKEALGDGPAKCGVKRLRAMRVEVDRLTADRPRMPFNRCDQTGAYAPLAILWSDQKSGKPGTLVTVKIKFLTNQETVSHKLAIDLGDQRRLKAVARNNFSRAAASSATVRSLPSKKAAWRKVAAAAISDCSMGRMIADIPNPSRMRDIVC